MKYDSIYLLTTICDAPVDGKNYIRIQLTKSNSIGQYLRSCVIVAVFQTKWQVISYPCTPNAFSHIRLNSTTSTYR